MVLEIKNEKIYINGEVCTNAEMIGYVLLDMAEIAKSNITINENGEIELITK